MDKVLELSKKYNTLLNKYNINTSLRLSHFFAQLVHESGLKPISENLNYSKEGLLKIFPKYFTKDSLDKNDNVILGTASLYARKPQSIANKVYANRNGNNDEKSGDGWKYRGRGFMQITMKNNYKDLSKDTGIDYINNPDLLLNEADAMIAALWYWKKIDANKLADIDDLDKISDRINIGRDTIKIGDSNGYQDRYNHLIKLKKIFK
jgi:putative chitinase